MHRDCLPVSQNLNNSENVLVCVGAGNRCDMTQRVVLYILAASAEWIVACFSQLIPTAKDLLPHVARQPSTCVNIFQILLNFSATAGHVFHPLTYQCHSYFVSRLLVCYGKFCHTSQLHPLSTELYSILKHYICCYVYVVTL